MFKSRSPYKLDLFSILVGKRKKFMLCGQLQLTTCICGFSVIETICYHGNILTEEGFLK
jgi:hypothetical protein